MGSMSGSAVSRLERGGRSEKMVSVRPAWRVVAACMSAAASGHHLSREDCVIHRVQASLNSWGLAVAGGGSGGHMEMQERGSGEERSRYDLQRRIAHKTM